MKKKIILVFFPGLLFLITVVTQGQPSLKVYGYKQASISGVAKNRSGGETSQAKSEEQTFNYWFYIKTSKSVALDILDLWISGKRFNPKTEPVTELPVKKTNYTAAAGNETRVLVPFTKGKILLSYPAGLNNGPAQISKYLSNLVSGNELVISYSYKEKRYYKILKILTVLEPEARQ